MKIGCLQNLLISCKSWVVQKDEASDSFYIFEGVVEKQIQAEGQPSEALKKTLSDKFF